MNVTYTIHRASGQWTGKANNVIYEAFTEDGARFSSGLRGHVDETGALSHLLERLGTQYPHVNEFTLLLRETTLPRPLFMSEPRGVNR